MIRDGIFKERYEAVRVRWIQLKHAAESQEREKAKQEFAALTALHYVCSVHNFSPDVALGMGDALVGAGAGYKPLD